MAIEAEALLAILKQHIKVDATGLSPAVASAFVTGFDEAVEAIRSALAEDTARAAEIMRERCAEVALSLRHERSGEWHDASRDRAIGRRNRVLAEVATTIRALPLDKEAAR